MYGITQSSAFLWGQQKKPCICVLLANLCQDLTTQVTPLYSVVTIRIVSCYLAANQNWPRINVFRTWGEKRERTADGVVFNLYDWHEKVVSRTDTSTSICIRCLKFHYLWMNDLYSHFFNGSCDLRSLMVEICLSVWFLSMQRRKPVVLLSTAMYSHPFPPKSTV